MKSRYTRWYYWLIYLAVGSILAVGVAIWIEESAYRARMKERFVTTCVLLDTGATERHCQCIWGELRRDYSVPEMESWGYLLRGEGPFDDMVEAYVACE